MENTNFNLKIKIVKNRVFIFKKDQLKDYCINYCGFSGLSKVISKKLTLAGTITDLRYLLNYVQHCTKSNKQQN